VLNIVVLVYLGGWIVTAICAYAVGRRLGDERRPSPHPILLSVVAGAVWPFLLLGAVELSSVALFAKAMPQREPGVMIVV
jgi:hypothetical protein